MKRCLVVAASLASLAAPVVRAAVEESGSQAGTRFGVRLMPGYSTSIGGSPVDYDGRGGRVYLSDGAGLNVQAEFFMKLGTHFEAGIETGYWQTSKTTSFSDWSSTYPVPDQPGCISCSCNFDETDTRGLRNYSSTWTGSVIPVRLWLRGFVPVDKWRLFAGVAAGYYFPSVYRNTLNYDSYSVVTCPASTVASDNQVSEVDSFSLKSSFGFAAEVGVEVPLGANFGLFTKTQMNLIHFWPSSQTQHGTLTSTLGGTPWGTYAYDITTNYVDSMPYSYPCTTSSPTTTTTIADCGQYRHSVYTSAPGGPPFYNTESTTKQAVADRSVPATTLSFQVGVYRRF